MCIKTLLFPEMPIYAVDSAIAGVAINFLRVSTNAINVVGTQAVAGRTNARTRTPRTALRWRVECRTVRGEFSVSLVNHFRMAALGRDGK